MHAVIRMNSFRPTIGSSDCVDLCLSVYTCGYSVSPRQARIGRAAGTGDGLLVVGGPATDTERSERIHISRAAPRWPHRRRGAARRRTRAAASGSWVAITTAAPRSASARSSGHDPRPVGGVELAGRLVGEHHAALAGPGRGPRATRCCWPPDSSSISWSPASPEPTASSAASARRGRLGRGTPAASSGTSDVLGGGQDAGQARCPAGSARPRRRRRWSRSRRAARRPPAPRPRGPGQPGQHPQQGGLPGARRPGHRHHPARRAPQVHAGEHLVAVVVDVHVAGDDLGAVTERPSALQRGGSCHARPPRLGVGAVQPDRVLVDDRARAAASRAARAPGRRGGSVSEPSRATTANSSPRRPSAPTRPSRIVTVRGSRAATSGSWVTTTTVVPRSRLTSPTASSTSSRASWSSWLVGSSSSSRPGRAASPTPTASRWR